MARDLFDPSIPIRLSHAMRTSSQWTAMGALYVRLFDRRHPQPLKDEP